MKKSNQNKIANLIKSFRYAFRGFVFAVNNERNMRIHIVVAILVAVFSFLYGLGAVQYALIFLCFGLVIAAEMFNTAIEALVNLETPAYDHLARIAKDVAAGAVLVSAIMTVVAAVFTFHDLNRLWETVVLIVTTPVLLVCFLLLIALGLFFIFGCTGKVKPQDSKNDNYKS